MGQHSGIGVLFKKKCNWLVVAHCLNHCLELSIKEFKLSTYFQEVDLQKTRITITKKVQNEFANLENQQKLLMKAFLMQLLQEFMALGGQDI